MMLRVASFAVCLVLAFSYHAKDVNFIQIGKQADQPSPPGQFVYKACNKTNAAIFIKTLEVKPNKPIEFGKTVVVSAEVELAETIEGQIDYDMDIQMCIPNYGCQSMCDLIPDTCKGTDVCTRLSKLSYKCPTIVKEQGSNCTCPFKKNTYQFKNIPVKVPVPPAQITGNFTITMKLMQGKTELSCSWFNFCIGNCGN